MNNPTPFMIVNAHTSASRLLSSQISHFDTNRLNMIFKGRPRFISETIVEFEMEFSIHFAFTLLIINGLSFLTEADWRSGHLNFYNQTRLNRSEGGVPTSSWVLDYDGTDTDSGVCKFVIQKMFNAFQLFDEYIGCLKRFSISAC